MDVKKGQLLAISQGEYSEYEINSICVSLRDFNLDEQEEIWISWLREVEGYYEIATDEKYRFLAFMIDRGFIQVKECAEVHIGSNYGWGVSVRKTFEES